MCGIFLHIGNITLEEKEKALHAVRHRGPDASGYKNFAVQQNKKLFLGHTRLSIIDLAHHADQPLKLKNKNLWVIFNGEIYNYSQVRNHLIKHRYEFYTNSDTEVLLASFDYWEEKCLNYLNGMFSFCIYNENTNQLFCARDRFGVKPLYYWNYPSGFAVASEIKQFTKLKNFDRKVNLQKVASFIYNSEFAFDKETMWQEVYELEPGQYFKLDLNSWTPGQSIEIHQWYDYQNYLRTNSNLSFNITEDFYYLLENSVEMRLRSDVDIGTLLSGGIDSSAITALAANKQNKNIALQAFSACFSEKKYDESVFIDALKNHVHFQPHKIPIRASHLQENFQHLIYHFDLPIVGRSDFAHYTLYQNIQNHSIKVILEGQGADEILLGYPIFHHSMIHELLTRYHVFKALKELFYFAATNHSRYQTLKAYIMLYPSFQKIAKMIKKHNEPLINNLLVDKHLTLYDKQNKNPQKIKETTIDRFKILRRILHAVDRVSMANSIETRVPFLDHRLVEFCLQLSTEDKIKNGLRKLPLRDAMKNVLPYSIVERKDKRGFGSPQTNWAQKELNLFYRQGLNKASKLPFVNSATCEKIYEQVNTNRSNYLILFRLIAVAEWMEIFSMHT